MKLQPVIVDFIQANPDKTSNEIADATQIPVSKVKVVLCKLTKSGKIVRTRKANETKKAGPTSQYIYKLSA